MLSSITPLGERSRNRRWRGTAIALAVSTIVGGAALGVVMGVAAVAAGGLPAAVRWSFAALVALVLVVLHTRHRLPTPHRQVDVTWLELYRGWVTGVGYGVQLGLGFLTVVVSPMTWVMGAIAVASGRFAVAVAVGIGFGVARALPLLSVRHVESTSALQDLHSRLAAWAGPVATVDRVLAVVATASLAAVAVLLVLR